MSGSIFYTWEGAGMGWMDPGAPGVSQVTANLRNRFYPIDYSMSSRIQSGSAQNRADFSQFSEAVKHAGVDSKKNLR
ncbi:MAG: hypothetical protein GW778_03015 [Alphaproteobacteria bacterium]|nr:hypothetical protein [Alphaproteobacteria bacterium]